ncbi:MAG: helix-turn-helix domain-containing protein [Acidobacteria bacterium]|nr:helix-turn-helix domain-containing protein [Acidobacteriota bacterium]
MTGSPATQARVMALAGGKGGVGTTLLAANLAIHLARQGREVILLDLAPSGPSAHAHIGVPFPQRHLGELLPESTPPRDDKSRRRRRQSASALAKLCVASGIPNLKIIAGVPDDPSCPPRDDTFGARILGLAPELPCDIVIADLGSGHSRGVRMSCRAATSLLMVTTPEPQALRGLLRLHANALHGVMEEALSGIDTTELTALFTSLGLRGVLEAIHDRSRLHQRLLDALERRRYGLILNQVRTQAEVEAATRIGAVLSMVQAVVVDPVVSLEYDLSAVQATGEGKVLSQSYPNAAVVRGLERLITAFTISSKPSRKPRGGNRYAPVSTWHHYRILALDPRSSPREVQRHYEWIRAPFQAGGEAEAVATRTHLDTVLARVEAAYRTLLFLENRREYDQELVRAGIMERSSLRALAQDVHDEVSALSNHTDGGQRAGESTAPAAADPSTSPPAGKKSYAGTTANRAQKEVATPPDEDLPSPADRHYNGTTLGRLRRRRRMDLDRIAEITKIRVPQIESMETDDYSSLPVPVFLRGFLRAYAICLDLDPDKVVNDYMEGYDAWARMRL